MDDRGLRGSVDGRRKDRLEGDAGVGDGGSEENEGKSETGKGEGKEGERGRKVAEGEEGWRKAETVRGGALVSPASSSLREEKGTGRKAESQLDWTHRGRQMRSTVSWGTQLSVRERGLEGTVNVERGRQVGKGRGRRGK